MYVLYLTANIAIIVLVGVILPLVLIDLLPGAAAQGARPLMRVMPGLNAPGRSRWPFGPLRQDRIKENERSEAIKLGRWPERPIAPGGVPASKSAEQPHQF